MLHREERWLGLGREIPPGPLLLEKFLLSETDGVCVTSDLVNVFDDSLRLCSGPTTLDSEYVKPLRKYSVSYVLILTFQFHFLPLTFKVRGRGVTLENFVKLSLQLIFHVRQTLNRRRGFVEVLRVLCPFTLPE